jgi:hypothetical protein
MYRLLEKIPASPKHSRIRQEPPPTKRSLKRGNRPEEPAEGAVDITTVLIRFGRPVTSAGQRNATLGSGVSCIWSHQFGAWFTSLVSP